MLVQVANFNARNNVRYVSTTTVQSVYLMIEPEAKL